MTETPTPLDAPLFSPLQIAVASFIGGPVAACWFFARNYRTLGQPRRARIALAWGAGGLIVLGVLSYFLPPSFPHAAVPIGYTFGLYQTAHQIHGAIVREHRAIGGALGPWPQVIAISLAILVAVLALMLVADALVART